MTLGAGGPRSYHGTRFPGIPGLSGLSPQSHGALKVDRQNAHQHVSPAAFDAVSQVVDQARDTLFRRSEEDMQALTCIRSFSHAERLRVYLRNIVRTPPPVFLSRVPISFCR